MITPEIAESIDQSVLSWLATTSEDGYPNVSPKEAFLHDGHGKILVANIASPVSAENIEKNNRVCLSFVNVFTQKGHKIKGRASLRKEGEAGYDECLHKVTSVIGNKFPIMSIIEIEPESIAEIIAPSYLLFPDSGEEDRIKESLKSYKVEQYQTQMGDKEPETEEVNGN